MIVTTSTLSPLHAEWTEHYPLARWLVRRKLIRLDGSVPPDIDDRVSEAIAHAWVEFLGIRRRRPEFDADAAVRLACKTGVSRVYAKSRFVPKRYQSYVDAMDKPREGYFEDAVPQLEPEPYKDPSDTTAMESMIDGLDDDLKAVARLLATGMSKVNVAKQLGVSRSTVFNRIHQLQHQLS